MRILFAVLCGFCLDLQMGDPAKLSSFHPVVWMGHAIAALEKAFRRHFSKTPEGEFRAGLLLVIIMTAGTLLASAIVLLFLQKLCPPFSFLLETIWCWQALAVRDLRTETLPVEKALENRNLEQARQAVSRVVGRETAQLDEDSVARAAVETVAENFSDGVIAPLIYMLLGGAPLALAYKAINTMDSMLGYKIERYLFFGRAAARLDDAANYLPSRIAAILLIAAAGLTGEDADQALRIWRRDSRKHESPNAAQCEAAMAGALGLRLCGPAVYFGKVHDKPWIGDEKRRIVPGDIHRACRLEYVGAFTGLAVFGLLRLACILAIGG